MIAKLFQAVKIPALLDVGGVGCLVAAAFTWETAAGLVALGLALPLLGWRFDK